MRPLTRRQAIGASLFLPPLLLTEWRRAVDRGAVERPYLDAALRAEHWIRSHAIDSGRGRTWPAVPGAAKGGGPDASLYTGAPGVVAFYLELHAHTGERRFLEEAVRGALAIADELPSTPEVRDAGLYTGLAGHLAILDLVHHASGRADVGAAATRAARVLRDSAAGTYDPDVPDAAAWNPVTDIVSGAAGSALALLAARARLGDSAVGVARRVGNALVARAQPVADGQRRWMMSPAVTREMPNFSHGTAGVAYFLATLAQQGGEPRHLDAALDGARYLRAIAAPAGDGTLIRHHDGDGAALFYLSWCHGPPGTARLWQRLAAVDPAERVAPWRALEEAGVRGLASTGVPEQRTAGFWNNVSQCCGNAGVAEYFLSRWERTRRAEDLAHARRHADDALRRGTTDGKHGYWTQAENRVSPDQVAAQTGWMQGAAGVGAMLLRLDAATRGAPVRRAAAFPDLPG